MTDLDGFPHSEMPEQVAGVLGMAGRFGIDRVTALSQFESYGNENWLLEMPGGDRVVARRYVHTPAERVQFQMGLQQRLHRAGFPVSAVLTSKLGGPAEMDDQGTSWAVFEHVDGREYNFSIEDAVQAARRLAEFHLYGLGVASEAPALRHRPSMRECWARSEADVAELRTMLAGSGLDEELNYLDAWWRDVRQAWPLARLDALPRGLVHGDYHGRNTAYEGDRLRAIFDFDDAEAGPLVHDLAWSAYKFARGSRFQSSVRPDVLRAFIDAYDAVRTLTPEERSALPVMMAMTYPPNPRYYAYYRDQRGSDLQKRLRREVGVMRVIREGLSELF